MTITLRLHGVWLRAIATRAAGSSRLVRAVPGPLCALAIAGCSVFGPDRPDLSISLTSDVSLAAGHVFRVEVSGKRYDLALGSQPRVRYELERHAPSTGNLDVTASLRAASGQPVATVSFTQRYSKSDDHWVAGQVGLRRPEGICLGTLIAVPIVPPLSSAADSLFIMYGSIPRDAIC